MITDTHTHLYSEQFDTDRKAMMERAFDAGIFRFFIEYLREPDAHLGILMNIFTKKFRLFSQGIIF